MSADSIDILLEVKKADLYLLCPFLESFEGMAAIRIPFPEAGEYAKLKLMVSPDFFADYEKLLAGLGKRFWIERVN
jgi:hypothetical protein